MHNNSSYVNCVSSENLLWAVKNWFGWSNAGMFKHLLPLGRAHFCTKAIRQLERLQVFTFQVESRRRLRVFFCCASLKRLIVEFRAVWRLSRRDFVKVKCRARRQCAPANRWAAENWRRNKNWKWKKRSVWLVTNGWAFVSQIVKSCWKED